MLAFLVCYLLIPGVGARGPGQHLLLGLGLAIFMAAFDIALGKLVMRFEWRRIEQDFNPARGQRAFEPW